MFFFRKKQKDKKMAAQEAVIKAIQKDTFRKIDAATKATREANKLMEEFDVTRMIFEATGGRRRSK